MVSLRLDQILSKLVSRELLGPETFAGIDIQEALEVRYQQSNTGLFYDSASDREELEVRWRILPIHQDLRDLHDLIIEQAYANARPYVRAHDPTSDELASSYIMHEFGLIAKSRVLRWQNEWIDSIWAQYEIHQLPMPPWPGLTNIPGERQTKASRLSDYEIE